MADVQLFGLWPGGHHLMNVLFHIANVLLLYGVLRRMTAAVWPSALVAALFALHPLHVESVAWAAERKDVLSTLLAMLTLWAYARYAARPAVARYALVFGLFALGLMAKPMLVTLPFVLLLLDFWPLGRFGYSTGGAFVVWPDTAGGHNGVPPWRAGPPLRSAIVGAPPCGCPAVMAGHGGRPQRSPAPPRRIFDVAGRAAPTVRCSSAAAALRLVLEKLPLLVLSAASSLATYHIQQAAGAVMTEDRAPWQIRASNALVSYVAYIGKMFWPSDLSAFYPFTTVPPVWEAVLAAVALVAITLVVLWQVRRRPYLAVGWFWYLGTLVPVIGLVQVGGQAMADRYTYIPMMGLFIMIAWGMAELVGQVRWRQAAAGGAAAVVLLGCAVAGRVQMGYWANDFTLFDRGLALNAADYVSHIGLGQALEAQGKKAEAVGHYTEAVRIHPLHAPAHSSLGKLLAELGRFDEAIPHLEEAVRLRPQSASSQSNLGVTLVRTGDERAGLDHCREAVRLEPDDAAFRLNLGLALRQCGDTEGAIAAYRQALRLDPRLPEAHNNLGVSLAALGDRDAAIAEFQEALGLRPGYVNAHDNLGRALAAQGRFDEAIAQYTAVLSLTPSHADVMNRLAAIRATCPEARFRNGAEAVALATRACQIAGRPALDYLETLAAAYAEAGRFPEAVATAREAAALAATQKRTDAAQFEARLNLYLAGKPYREPARPPAAVRE
jgi:Flp pilus assembly protein TadD